MQRVGSNLAKFLRIHRKRSDRGAADQESKKPGPDDKKRSDYHQAPSLHSAGHEEACEKDILDLMSMLLFSRTIETSVGLLDSFHKLNSSVRETCQDADVPMVRTSEPHKESNH
ncbi:MAG: uncharacterized protein KVP18_003698 [Porospora cf. gigantea A]|uniref:uncharacterized protein n=1 Tax=Porospora cf. gigantea A TaxID=2853593 RepID=UPI00355A4C38|nr:MAG: hypothetical protein KVP18_003698 [Porospora cf. gigantea A]